MDMFKLKDDTLISKVEIFSIVSNLLHSMIEKNVPHIWYKTEEPFINNYTGNLSYDYSGEVRKATLNDLINLKENLGLSQYSKFCCESHLDELLSSIYVDRWEATYTSNYGKNWLNLKNMLERDFNAWKYENFDIFDEDDEEIVEGLDTSLDEVLVEFLKEVHYGLYFKEILKSIK